MGLCWGALEAIGCEFDQMRLLLKQLGEQVSKMEAHSKQQKLVLTIAAHDIRSPVAGAKGLLELLLETPLSEDQRVIVMDLIRAMEQNLSFLNQLMVLVGMMDRDAGFERVSVTSHEMVQDVFQQYQTIADHKSVDLVMDGGACSVFGYPENCLVGVCLGIL